MKGPAASRWCEACEALVQPKKGHCPTCSSDLTDLDDGDGAATRHWSGAGHASPIAPPSSGDSIAEMLVWAPRRRIWLAIAGVVVLVIAVVALAIAAGRSPKRAPQNSASAAGLTAASTESPPSETWWTPPPGKRENVEALSYGFPGLDEHDLGAVFDAGLQPIFGAQPLFEKHEPRRIRRDEMMHSLVELRDTLQYHAGFGSLFAEVGVSWNASHVYRSYRAMQLAEVVRVDDNQRMREPPPSAVFYLAEVHRGASYDMLIDGEAKDMGAKLDLSLGAASVSVGTLQASGRYTVHQRGAGLRPTSGEAIFATSPTEVAAAYETTGTPVPIRLVFRGIPGRTIKRKKLPEPRVVVDQTFDLAEGRSTNVPFDAAAQYAIEVSSTPEGASLKWRTIQNCDPPFDGAEHRFARAVCTVKRGATLLVENPTRTYLGNDNRVTLRVSRLPPAPKR